MTLADGEILSLKTAHMRVTGHEEMKLILAWKFYPHWLAFIVHEDAVHATCHSEESWSIHTA